MAATKNHDYHLVEPDPWPIIGATCAGLLFGGLVMSWHGNAYGKFVAVAGMIGVLITMYNWWSNTDPRGAFAAIIRRWSSFTCATG